MSIQIEILLRNSIESLNKGRITESQCLLKKILELDINNLDGLRIMAVTLALQGELDTALELTDRVIAMRPSDFQGHLNRGNILQRRYSFHSALEASNKAISLCPSSPEAHNNRANTLQSLNRYQEALESYGEALSLNPNYADALNNRGNAFKALKKFDLAILDYFRAIEINPNDASAHWNLSLTQLLLGDYAEGLKNYEFRWLRDNAEPYLHPKIEPLKCLSNLKNKHVLAWSEQGYGDTLQFSRFVAPLMNLGARVTLQVQAPLVTLFENCFECTVISTIEQIPLVDFQVPLGSLPLLFDTRLETIPSNVPYIKIGSKIQEWKTKLNIKNNKLKIGIACSGNIKYDLEHGNTRPLPLKFFNGISHLYNLFLIQKEIRPEDQDFLSGHSEIIFMGGQIQNFEDTAAIVENMDLIVSVDTSLAHLAGAIGKSTYVLLPWSADWRWLSDEKKSPWYPNTYLFRQKKMGEWAEVFERVKLAIATHT